MDSKITFKEIAHKSPDWEKAVELRRKILRIPLGMDFSKEELENEYSDMHFAGFLDGQVVAAAVLRKANDEDLQLRQICVDDSHQGKGYGSELNKIIESAAKEKSYKRIIAHARKTALKFYERLDYQIEGDEYILVTIPHRKVIKILSES